ncbi:2'-5' RNA ligase family protein [Streptomyces sp. NPDC090046]|uniref:2'-5' RNA ligase family protein n=1 Tax=Streptomyces sp. NPDC090046 TaxID=3365928 RepID=UPI00381603F2
MSYLVPEPDTQVRQLTQAIADRWPEAPPYRGRFTEAVPYLTIAQGQEDAALKEIEADLTGRLPFTARVSSAELMVHDGTKWSVPEVLRGLTLEPVSYVVPGQMSVVV